MVLPPLAFINQDDHKSSLQIGGLHTFRYGICINWGGGEERLKDLTKQAM